jgi:hypothetical protein
MSAIGDAIRGRQARDKDELPHRLADFSLTTSTGKPEPAQCCWRVVLSTDGHQIRRDIWSGPGPGRPDAVLKPWQALDEGWEPEGIIWPTWPTGESTAADSPLAGMQQCWVKAGDRLRDSAKWMATVLGVALAAVVGTSPLTPLRQHHPAGIAIGLGLGGLALLGLTLFLVLQVMRPQEVSYTDIQTAHKGALTRWRSTVEAHEDLYLPCGVNDLTSLRQSMIVEEVTLLALAQARGREHAKEISRRLCEAQAARSARLQELRVTAAQIETIGDYYQLRAKSTLATYGGVLCGLAGSAAIIAAFAWPLS